MIFPASWGLRADYCHRQGFFLTGVFLCYISGCVSTSSLYFWPGELCLSKPSLSSMWCKQEPAKYLPFGWSQEEGGLCSHMSGAFGCSGWPKVGPQLRAAWTSGPQHQLLHSTALSLCSTLPANTDSGYLLIPHVRKNDVRGATDRSVWDVAGRWWVSWNWQIGLL